MTQERACTCLHFFCEILRGGSHIMSIKSAHVHSLKKCSPPNNDNNKTKDVALAALLRTNLSVSSSRQVRLQCPIVLATIYGARFVRSILRVFDPASPLRPVVTPSCPVAADAPLRAADAAIMVVEIEVEEVAIAPQVPRGTCPLLLWNRAAQHCLPSCKFRKGRARLASTRSSRPSISLATRAFSHARPSDPEI